MRLTGLLAVVALFSIGACGGGDGSAGPGSPSGNTPTPPGGITVTNNRFLPVTKTVAPGETVVWAWSSCTGEGGYEGGQTCVEHNVTFDAGPPHSSTRQLGSFSRTFPAAGTYTYHCSIHQPEGMTGTIEVQ